MDRRCRCRTPMPLDRRGRGHTRWRDRPMARGGPDGACPRPGGAGPRLRASVLAHGACHGAPPSRRCLRSAQRAPGRLAAQRWHTPALGALAPGDERPCPGTCMPGCTDLRPGAPVGAAMAYTRRAGEGCAGRLTSCRGVARSLTLPREPARARGARYALGAWGEVSGRREGLAGERVGREAAQHEAGCEQEGQGQDGEHDVGGVDAHGELLRGRGGGGCGRCGGGGRGANAGVHVLEARGGGGRREVWRCMTPQRRTRPVREASSSSTVTWVESADFQAKQGKGVSGEVVQRGRSRGDAAGSSFE